MALPESRSKYFLLFFFVFAGCNLGERTFPKDPLNPLVEKIPFETLFADDIDQIKKQIDSVAVREGYENLDLMLKLCREHPVIEIRCYAGGAAEKIMGQIFGLSQKNEHARRKGLSQALLWWRKNRQEKLSSVLVDKLIPYLEREFDDIDEASFFDRVVRDLPASSYRNAAEAINLLTEARVAITPRLQGLLKEKKTSNFMKEKIAFVLGGQQDIVLMELMPSIIDQCDRIEKKIALYQLWYQDDPAAASRSLWNEIDALEESGEKENFDYLIRTAAGITPKRTSAYLKNQLLSDDKDVAKRSFELIGSLSLSEHISLVVDGILSSRRILFRERFEEVSVQLGASRVASLLLKRMERNIRGEKQRILEALLLISSYVDEFEKINLLKRDPETVDVAARLLRDNKSKSAVFHLIESIGLAGDENIVLETLEYLTAHDFSEIDEQVYQTFKSREQGSEESIRRKYLVNRARLWWSDHKGMTMDQWYAQALTDIGFNEMAADKHPLSTREKDLVTRLLSSDYPEKNKMLNFLIDSDEPENISFVLNYIQSHQNPLFSEVLRSRVDKHRPYSTNFALAFCQVAGPEYHHHFRGLLRHTDPNIVSAATDALIKWGAYREIPNLIRMVEVGSEEDPHLAQAILQTVSGLKFGSIVGITTPQRRMVVDQWKSWWNRVHNDDHPYSWVRKEIDYLIGELGYDAQSDYIKRRIQFLMHQNILRQGTEFIKDFWKKHRESWGTHGAEVTGLLSNNWWRVDAGHQFLVRYGTPRDVIQMVSLLDLKKPRENQNLLKTLRVLTGKSFGYSPELSVDEQNQALDRWRNALHEGELFDYLYSF